MIHLNYKTNKELVKEMQRILPDFEFELEYIMDPGGGVWHYTSANPASIREFPRAITPSDVIRFLQDERVRKIVHEYRMFDPRVISMHLIYSYEIFLSSENFQRGVEDVLLPALKKIK